MLWSRTDPHNATDNSRARRQGYPNAARAHNNEERIVQEALPRRLRPEHVIAFDESMGICYKISQAVKQKKGVKHVKQRGLQATPRAQLYSKDAIWCSAAQQRVGSYHHSSEFDVVISNQVLYIC